MIISRKLTDQFNILDNVTGYPDCYMPISRLLAFRSSANAVILYAIMVNGTVRYQFTPLVIPQNDTDVYLLDNKASNLPVNMYDSTIAYQDDIYNTDAAMYCYQSHLQRFEERGIGILAFTRNNKGYKYYNLDSTSGLENVIYIPDWIQNIYINDALQLNWENANTALYKLGTKTYGLQDEWLSKLNEENPFSGITITHSNLFTYMVDTGDIIDIDWSKGIQTIEMKYGKIVMGSDGYGRVHVYDNNNGIIVQITGILTWLTTRNLYFIACVNHEHQVGRIGLIVDPGSYGTSLYISSPSKNREAYEFITQNVLGATVKVNYYIPEGTYQYCKLTYKKDKEPESVNDGTIVNIDPTETDCLVKGLEEEQTYYFTIYTDKSESNPFPFVVGEVPVPPGPTPDPEYVDIINQINNWAVVNNFETYGYYSSSPYQFNGDPKNYSWVTYPDSNRWNNYDSGSKVYNTTCYERVTINITENNGIYSVSFSNSNTANGYTGNTFYANPYYFPQDTDKKVYIERTGSTYWSIPSDFTISTSLMDVFTKIRNNIKYVNIYVNNVLWALIE